VASGRSDASDARRTCSGKPQRRHAPQGIQLIASLPQSYKDFPKLERCLAVLYETLRLHPSVTIIPKVALEDTYLPDDTYPLPLLKESESEIPTPFGQRRAFIPKGSHVHIDTTALHLHPSHWADPAAFKPERFLEDYNKDAFLPFSAGARACIGRRFAEVETVCILALMIRTFDITPIPSNESFEQKRERLLAAVNKLTLTPKKALPLRLIKRDVRDLDWDALS
jgi:cytochrome P450